MLTYIYKDIYIYIYHKHIDIKSTRSKKKINIYIYTYIYICMAAIQFHAEPNTLFDDDRHGGCTFIRFITYLQEYIYIYTYIAAIEPEHDTTVPCCVETSWRSV